MLKETTLYKRFLFCLFSLLIWTPGWAQVPPSDSIPLLVRPITGDGGTNNYYIAPISIIQTGLPNGQIVSSPHVLNGYDFEKFDPTSLEPVLNTIPGVKMETRGTGGSRRLSIRGSLLRSPFGVRNIKAYWEDMPLSMPDGSMPLELVDPAFISSLIVAKGPSDPTKSSLNGGALTFGSSIPYHIRPALEVKSATQIGSFGMIRTANTVAAVLPKSRLFAGYVHQQLDGYREQESNQKDMVYFRGLFYPNYNHTFKVYAWHYKGDWDLPGALNDSTARTNPTSAVPYSITANASVERVRTRLGITSYNNIRASRLTTNIYGYKTTKVNPYGTSPFFNGYKEEAAWGFGGRSSLVIPFSRPNFFWMRPTLQVGIEAQGELNHQLESENEQGTAGDLFIDRKVRSMQSFLFAKADIPLKKAFSLAPAINLNLLNYRIDDQFALDSIDFSGRRNFTPMFAPHLRIEGQQLSWEYWATVNGGFSPPSFWEVSNSDGSINTDLEAETSVQYTLGGRYTRKSSRFSASLELYALFIRNTIIPSTLPSGEVIFENKGKTQQPGAELWLGYYGDGGTFFKLIYPWISFAYQPYTFQDYTKDGVDFSGNQLTGVPDILGSAGIVLESRMGVYLKSNIRYVGKTAINDANTSFQDPYALVEGKLGYQYRFKKFMSIDVYAGVNNALNTYYTSFLQLNGFGGRFYNPAPERNFYGGVKVGFRLDQWKSK